MTDEIRKEQIRLLTPPTDQETTGLGARFIVICDANAPSILSRGKDIMISINKYSFPKTPWPSSEQWRDILPKSFTEKLKLDSEILNLSNKDDDFTLESWLHWMNPQNRTWYWWDSSLFSVPIRETHFVVSLKTRNEIPYFSANSFKCLFKTCGAIDILSEDEL